jgi:hypothetical protein
VRVWSSVNAFTFSIGNPEGKELSETTSPRREDNIKKCLKETECDYAKWIVLNRVKLFIFFKKKK